MKNLTTKQLFFTRRLFLIALIFIQSISVFSQYPGNTLPEYPENWNCMWVTHPDIDPTAFNLIHFRNKFSLDDVPNQFIVHVSGDNRYRLYVNEEEVCYGPQLGDIRHWRYETIDLAPFLKKGENIVSAEVMNWGIERSYGIISFKTGFLLQGNSKQEVVLNTGYNSNWKVLQNKAIHEKTVHWRGGGDIVGGFYASNPTDSIVAFAYPWGWQSLDYDDSEWQNPKVIFSAPKTNAGAGHGWILQPRTTSVQVSKKENLTRVVKCSLQNVNADFQLGEKPLVIPPNAIHNILIDQGRVTLGYPKLSLSKGNRASVKVKYSEALYDADNHKGNRNEIEGKEIKGISDVYLMDGGLNRIFQPIWFRTFRFIELTVETKDEPLVINDFYNVYSASPIPVKATFETDNPVYQEIWNICKHGLEMTAQDNLLSDLYYEQMQYVGDLRPHLMAWASLTGDLTYFKSAMEQFNNSRLPDGNVTSCYPLKATFVHPTYSLIWIDMLHDLMMRNGDKEEMEFYLSEIDEVFDYYESTINEKGLVGKTNYHMFVDWYLPKGGNSKVNRSGNSAILTLNYAYTLKNASEILSWLGYRGKANYYANQSRKYAEIVRRLCFDPEKGIYTDDPEKTFYDQRASILAILTEAHSSEEKELLIQKILDENTSFDSYANLFYYLYLFEAMEETGVGDFTKVLKPWKDIVDMGLTATPEKRIEQHPRSEVHPWTAHPVHFYFSFVSGIRPVKPGFEAVSIAPHPGELKRIEANYPTKLGSIEVKLMFENGKAKGNVTIPENMEADFEWKGKQQPLKKGINKIDL